LRVTQLATAEAESIAERGEKKVRLQIDLSAPPPRPPVSAVMDFKR
jgi:hypothetical protein